MTEWERARTQEQKASRESEIFDAAKHLLTIKSFDSIKLSDISEHVTFSRASIYQYFSTKEEIYLALLAKEIESFGIKVQDALKKIEIKRKSSKTFSEVWIQLISEERVMLNLLSMAGTILEKNCSTSILLQSKSSMALSVGNYLIPSVREFFPKKNDEKLSNLIFFCIILANGLYPLCGLNESQQSILRVNGLESMIHDFKVDYKKLIDQYLKHF
jgi:AcrR family transcriptional regulator